MSPLFLSKLNRDDQFQAGPNIIHRTDLYIHESMLERKGANDVLIQVRLYP